MIKFIRTGFILFSALWVISCDWSFDLNFGGVVPIEEPTPSVEILTHIVGEYEGSINYWRTNNYGAHVPDLSKKTEYLSKISTNNDLYTLSFDSSFIYTVPSLNFRLEGPNSIIIPRGQSYSNWHDPAGGFRIDTLNSVVTMTCYISLQSLPPDSTYYLEFYGTRILN